MGRIPRYAHFLAEFRYQPYSIVDVLKSAEVVFLYILFSLNDQIVIS